jgi:hypothetical protein
MMRAAYLARFAHLTEGAAYPTSFLRRAPTDSDQAVLDEVERLLAYTGEEQSGDVIWDIALSNLLADEPTAEEDARSEVA